MERSGMDESAVSASFDIIERGAKNNYKKLKEESEVKAGDQSVQKHKYLNFRQYVGANTHS